MVYDVIIAGAGVIGGMLARELSKYQLRICILEKENDVACGASRANSGIIHGGYDPEPGTLKAKFNTVGVGKLYQAADELNVPYIKNGSMVCAFGENEDEIVRTLYQRGLENQIAELEILSGEAARMLEPQLSKEVTSVLHVRNSGIICPYQLTIAAVGNAMDNGVDLKLNYDIVRIERNDTTYFIHSADGHFIEGKYLINCAGTGSDRIAKLARDDSFTIIPRSGEYLLLDKAEGTRVHRTIFQVPTAEGKGILVSPTVDGNLLLGPTATVVQDGSCTPTTQAGLETVQRLALKSVPTVDLRSVITSFSGVRASTSGSDFVIGFSDKVQNLLNVAAIDSPGLTCCVAIAEYVVDLLRQSGVELISNPSFNPRRQDVHNFQKLSDDEKNTYIQNNPEFGKIVCRCEGITEGEILQALRMNPPARDLDGVKRRTRSGMGRCQGGFCGPYVMQLIAQELKIPKEKVTKCGDGSQIVIGKR
jgi:glycerol-3-phosphate dehydrogenase